MDAITSLLKYRPKKEYICKESGLPWLKLNIDVPIQNIYKEYKDCKDLFVKHRNKDKWANLTHTGWYSATLYGVNTQTTTASSQAHDWTDLAKQCPMTVDWIKKNFIIDESTGRIRFMVIEPGGYILPHVDKKEKGLGAINVAITQPKGCSFRFLDKGTIPFNAGDAFIIDTSNRHLVWNKSKETRLHIILHTKISDKIIEESYADCFYSA